MYGKEFVSELVDRTTARVEKIGDFNYCIKSTGAELIRQPRYDKVTVFSLDPFITALGVVADSGQKLVVNIQSHDRVVAYLGEVTDDRTVEVLIDTDFSKAFESFKSGEKMSQEDFMVRLQSMFYTNLDREDIMKLVGAVKTDQESTTADDGVSQSVQVKAGVHLSKETKVRNPWLLRPYKSFPEIEPTEVPYVLRVTSERGGTQFALYESDGGRWRIKTAAAVRKYIVDQLAGLKIANVTVL